MGRQDCRTTDHNRGTPSEEGMRALVLVALVGAVTAAWAWSGDYRVLDPYGWHASGADPWERDARGTISSWLWKPGEAPALR